jgi:tRNA threonylcarbamoyladenosine biosynthesis protein TsaE
MVTRISHSPGETEALGESWGRAAESGLVIGLTGDLGAGKTQLARGIARGLGITARVHSPTFTLVNEYTGGRLTLYHIDLYRLETVEQIIGAGLAEYFQPAGISVIEWVEKALSGGASFAAGAFRHVHLETISETERRIIYEDSGA